MSGIQTILRERARQRRRRPSEGEQELGDDKKESVVHYDNEAFTDKEEDIVAPVSPLSERPSPRLPPIPVPRKKAPSEASTGPPTPSSSVSLKPLSASKERIRHRLRLQRRNAEQRRSITVEDPQPLVLPRAAHEQVDMNEDVLQDALRRRHEALSKWKTSASLALRQSEEAAQRTLADESADFFTKKWSSAEAQRPETDTAIGNSEPSLIGSKREDGDDKEAISPDADEPAAAEDEEDDDLLSADHYVQEEKLMYKMVKPTFVPLDERKLNESLIYHVPSARKVSLSTKEVDYHADSGEPGDEVNLQPSRTLPFSRFGANQMENRLVMQNELHWFDSSGNITSVENFLNERPSRLPSYSDTENMFHVRYSKASVYNPYNCDAEQYMELEIEVSSLKFHHHPLFSREHVLASSLSTLYESYTLLVLGIEDSNDKEKIKRLHEELEKMDADTEMHVIAAFKKKLMQLVDSRKLRDQKEKSLGEVLDKMSQVWEEIENLRRSQGYTVTEVTLRHSSEDATASTATTKDFEDELGEELQVREMVRRVELMEYDRKWRRPHTAKRSPGNTSLDSANSNETFEMKPLPPPELDEGQIAEEVRRTLEQRSKNAGTRENAAYLTQSSHLTPANQCPREEQHRKRDVANTRLYLRIVFNNKEVCKTKPRSTNLMASRRRS